MYVQWKTIELNQSNINDGDETNVSVCVCARKLHDYIHHSQIKKKQHEWERGGGENEAKPREIFRQSTGVMALGDKI